jgi:hypothetical protein
MELRFYTLETAMPGNYQALHYWSPILGDHAVRLSMFARGYEFFRIIPRVDGKGWRPARDAALTMIQEAIDAGCEPGEVGETEVYPNE